jgi:hypothetical protein
LKRDLTHVIGKAVLATIIKINTDLIGSNNRRFQDSVKMIDDSGEIMIRTLPFGHFHQMTLIVSLPIPKQRMYHLQTKDLAHPDDGRR